MPWCTSKALLAVGVHEDSPRGLFCGQGVLFLAHQDLHWGKQYFGLQPLQELIEPHVQGTSLGTLELGALFWATCYLGDC